MAAPITINITYYNDDYPVNSFNGVFGKNCSHHIKSFDFNKITAVITTGNKNNNNRTTNTNKFTLNIVIVPSPRCVVFLLDREERIMCCYLLNDSLDWFENADLPTGGGDDDAAADWPEIPEVSLASNDQMNYCMRELYDILTDGYGLPKEAQRIYDYGNRILTKAKKRRDMNNLSQTIRKISDNLSDADLIIILKSCTNDPSKNLDIGSPLLRAIANVQEDIHLTLREKRGILLSALVERIYNTIIDYLQHHENVYDMNNDLSVYKRCCSLKKRVCYWIREDLADPNICDVLVRKAMNCLWFVRYINICEDIDMAKFSEDDSFVVRRMIDLCEYDTDQCTGEQYNKNVTVHQFDFIKASTTGSNTTTNKNVAYICEPPQAVLRALQQSNVIVFVEKK